MAQFSKSTEYRFHHQFAWIKCQVFDWSWIIYKAGVNIVSYTLLNWIDRKLTFYWTFPSRYRNPWRYTSLFVRIWFVSIYGCREITWSRATCWTSCTYGWNNIGSIWVVFIYSYMLIGFIKIWIKSFTSMSKFNMPAVPQSSWHFQ